MSDDLSAYQTYQEKKLKEWENTCSRCGACCGVIEGDPCEHLQRSAEAKYYCDIYAKRFGMRKTVSEKPFLCVPIRNVLSQSWPGDECCGYKKKKVITQEL